jgi:hypothetical protein
MTYNAQTTAIAPPALGQEVRDSLLLFAMFALPISLVGIALDGLALLQSLAS